MRIVVLVMIFAMTFSASAQENVLSFKNLDFERSIRNVENYSFPDNNSGNLAIILGQKEEVYAYLYDKDLNKIDETSGTHLKKRFQEIIGYTINNARYTLVYTSKSRDKFRYVSLDFKDDHSKTGELEFQLDNERYLGAVVYNNRLIMISGSKDNELTLREFTEDFKFKNLITFQVDPDDNQKKLFNKFDFSDFLFLKGSKLRYSSVAKIDNQNPNRVERTSNPNKLYQQGSTVYLTFEEDGFFTIVNTIDLENLTLKTDLFEYPKGKLDDYKKYNSFIFENTFFHIASSRDEMIFQIKDLENNFLKEYYVDRESSIYFKNSSIFQDGSANKKKSKETQKFLKKMNSEDIGITVYKNNSEVQVTLGSYSHAQGGGGSGFDTANNTVTHSAGGSLPTYNPTYAPFTSNSLSKPTFINSLFDTDFNHIEGDLERNIFARIENHVEDIKWKTAENVFMHNDQLFFSYWSTKDQEYSLIKF